MSVQAMGWVLEHERTTSGADRLVLLALANHCGERDGVWECYPSIARIAREAGIARERTVQECLARLVAAGLVDRIVNAAPDERIRADRRPNLYRLRRTPATVHVLDGVTDTDIPSPVDEDVDKGSGVTGTDIPEPVDNRLRGDGYRRNGVTDTVTQTVSRTVTPSLRADARSALLAACRMEERELGREASKRTDFFLDALLEVGADEEQIQRRAAEYRRKWPEATLTPRALVRHWAVLAVRPVVRTVVVRCEPCGQAMPNDGVCRLDPALDGCPSVLAFGLAHG